jgi:hypothetical protein
MREMEIVIRLRLPQTPRKRWLLGGIAALVCASTLVYATVPNIFHSGDPVSSKYVNDNFANLDTRIGTFETPQAMQAATLANDWSNYSSSDSQLGYYKDPFGIVHLQGLVVEASANRSAITTLPAGYAPAKTAVFAIACGTGTGSTVALGLLDINSAGVITPDPTCTTTNYISLDGISFRAGQ